MSIQFSKCFIKLIFFLNNNNNRNQNSSHFKIQNLNHSLNKYGLPYFEFEVRVCVQARHKCRRFLAIYLGDYFIELRFRPLICINVYPLIR